MITVRENMRWQMAIEWGKLLQSKVKLHLADEMAGLKSLQNMRAANLRLVKKTQDGTIGQKTDDEMQPDDMQLGDTIHTTTNNTSRGLNTAGAIALAAAAGLAGWAINEGRQPAAPPTVNSGKDYGQDFYIGTPEDEQQNELQRP